MRTKHILRIALATFFFLQGSHQLIGAGFQAFGTGPILPSGNPPAPVCVPGTSGCPS